MSSSPTLTDIIASKLSLMHASRDLLSARHAWIFLTRAHLQLHLVACRLVPWRALPHGRLPRRRGGATGEKAIDEKHVAKSVATNKATRNVISRVISLLPFQVLSRCCAKKAIGLALVHVSAVQAYQAEALGFGTNAATPVLQHGKYFIPQPATCSRNTFEPAVLRDVKDFEKSRKPLG